MKIVETILSKLNNIPSDKQSHFMWGILLSYFPLLCGLLLKENTLSISVTTTAFICLCGIIKEVYDKMNSSAHTPDVRDAVATIGGGVVSVIMFNLFVFLTK